MKREYPEEIYYYRRGLSFTPGRDCLADLVENAYENGFWNGRAESASMDGFSSLSRAYGEGMKIDWELLEGKIARITSKKLDGFLEYRLQRNSTYPIDNIYGWLPGSGEFPAHLFNNAIKCFDDMELFVEGEIPFKKPTADELPAGTLFAGEHLGSCGVWVRYDRKRPLGGVEERAAKVDGYIDTNNLERLTVTEVFGDGVVPEEC